MTIDINKKYRTRGTGTEPGRPVVILTVDAPGEQQVIGYYDDERGGAFGRYADGSYDRTLCTLSMHDLIEVKPSPEEVVLEAYREWGAQGFGTRPAFGTAIISALRAANLLNEGGGE